ncbi:hypothetical protein DFR67_13124 [Williamsia limnetica]|uniref:Uncharacterized protein n=1 Tax=Williamsia limnetica TaxID=882452 RepID=A0A318RB39_WILLI|nr:hypothetical protein [Williamsia limnetica]PYE11778.1 hypothetical protein DFR67_13124 [Williamsia limnetica]
MSVSISQIRSWDLATLVSSADSADTGAQTFEDSALTVTNGLAGVDPSWDGDSRDRAAVRAAIESTNLTERATRWRAAATELRTAAEQLGLLKAEIVRLVDDAEAKSSVVGPVYSVADDGSVTVTAAFRAFYAETQGTGPGIGLVQEAERNAAQLQRQLKLLLANASMGAEYADWKITNALLGVTAEERPFHPTEAIPKPPKPKGPRIDADQDGSGPKDYDSVDSGLLDELGLTALRAGARFSGQGTYKGGLEQSPKLLNHYLKNKGLAYAVDVDAVLGELPRAGERAEQQAIQMFGKTRNMLPDGYTGPVVFEGVYGGPLGEYRADPITDPDWYLALGTFSFESTGVAIPSSDQQGYDLSYRTTVYDYYNWETTEKHWYPEPSDLNDLHRAGWAQNFDVVGTSSNRTTKLSLPH